ncbi:MAG: 3-deoxy-manno-octulosonate cytidylyltransferase [Prevotellaceae bacterium]|jgi:3-deoxy-manno-octulosonate cytidylyltransferase (CMP-KDO synthetase)|nr:3-deoxy-manno-octulosonate cytidylyltransferase [Prevotellaceae bacterium]
MIQENKDILIIIPARHDSSRLPGKPLLKIRGIEMVKRVASIASFTCDKNAGCAYIVATDDDRIINFCKDNSINVTLTSKDCRNGTERCRDTVERLMLNPKLVINLQGDNPLCPPWVIQDIIDEWKRIDADVYTPSVRLSWDEYDRLIASKKETPFSGTTVIEDKNGFALAFSKNVIPSVRKPEYARKIMTVSPVIRHIGLYAYTCRTLKEYNGSEESPYEKNCIEGLEQMRFLYNGYTIKLVATDYRGRETTGGVDSIEDIRRVEEIIDKFGELIPD